MELAHILNELWRRKVWLALGLVIALAAPMKVIYDLPSFQKKESQGGVATTDVLIDAPQSPLGAVTTDVTPLATRAAIYSQLIGSAPVKERIARTAGIPAGAIAVIAPPTASGQSAPQPQATGVSGGYLIQTATGGEGQPVLTISTQGPTAQAAIRLADATAAGLAGYIRDLQTTGAIERSDRVEILQLGRADGGLVLETVDYGDALLAYVVAFLGWCLLVLAAGRIIGGLREARAAERDGKDMRAAEQLP